MAEFATQMPKPDEPERVLIFDTTLRDGAQSPGISLSTDQSLQIARQLSHLGVDIIEAGFPVSSPGNFEAVQKIAQEVEGPVIAGLARVQAPDIDSAARAIQGSQRPRIHTFVSTSDIHIEHQMKTTREDVLGQARAGVAHAKSYVDDVEFSPMDATRSEPEFTAEVIQIAIDEGATTINIPDTVGYTQPEEFKAFIGNLYKLVPALGGVVLSVHCHDDLGMAVANSFAGIQAGARQVEVAVNGLGERAGNASLEEVVMLLRTRRQTDGYDTGVVSKLLGPTSRLVARHTGYEVQRNKAITGDNAFKHESGIHQAGVLNERSTFEIMSAESVGVDTESIVLGKQSGNNAMVYVLREEGVYDPVFRKATFTLFKELADKVGGISRQQIVEIHEEAQRRQTSPYRLNDYDITDSKQSAYSASVTISGPDGTKHAKAENDLDHPDIDGPISALYTAINLATNTNYKLEKHSLVSIGKGSQTIGKATVVLRVNGTIVTGKGLSLNSNKAAALAYLDAIRQTEDIKP